MSLDYYLVVPNEKWPTFDQLQAALDQDGLSITAVRPEGVPGSSPFCVGTSNGAFVFVNGEMEVHAGGSISSLGEDDFQIIEDTWGPDHANEAVDFMLKMALPVKIGDRLCHADSWKPADGFQVWWDVWHSFVRHFDAVLFDPQAGEASVLDPHTGKILTKPDPVSGGNDSEASIPKPSATPRGEAMRTVPTLAERLRKLLGMQA